MNRFLRGLAQFLIFFFLVAFLVTCCISLFTSTLIESLDIVLTEETLNMAARITFINVIVLSLLYMGVDALRRRFTVQRVTKRVSEAAQKIIAGDFSVRIPQQNPVAMAEGFAEIIDCFNHMAQELSGVETLRTDFISNVSHEMKTPLAVMQNYATLLQTPGLPDDKRIEYARGVAESSRRLADMMTNILKLNKLENQQIYPNVEKYDLGEQLCEALLQYESVWEKDNIDIDTDIADDVTVCADRELLSLVWNNLLSNAFKFTPPGGRITLSLTATAHHALVRVEDTGCGMSAETGAHIFEKFYQGDPSRSTRGNGLGLALVKRVVDIVGGEISVESELGRGSAFTVKIRRA